MPVDIFSPDRNLVDNPAVTERPGMHRKSIVTRERLKQLSVSYILPEFCLANSKQWIELQGNAIIMR